MASKQIVIDVPESVLAAEKSDEVSFGRELRELAAGAVWQNMDTERGR